MNAWWFRLMRYVSPHRGGLTAILVLGFVGVGISALMPWPMKLIADNVLAGRPLPDELLWFYQKLGSDGPGTLLLILVVATFVLFFVRQVNDAGRRYLQTSVGHSMAYKLGEDLFDELQRKSLLFQSQMQVGDLVRRVTIDSTCVRELWFKIIVPFICTVTSVIVMFAIMWRLDSVILLIVLGVALPLAILVKFMIPTMDERNFAQQELEGQLMAFAEQSLSSTPMIQAFDQIDGEGDRFRSMSSRTIEARMRTLATELWLRFGVGGTSAFGVSIVLGVGGYRVLEGVLTIGGLLVVLAYSHSIFGLMETLAYLSSTIAGARARALRVFDALDSRDRVPEPPPSRARLGSSNKLSGHIKVEHVSFGYEVGRPVLRDVSFEVQPGETIALMGRSGAGKSTLVSLIMRFADPWTGRILLDSFDLRDIPVREVRRQVSLVLQEPFLLPLTVAENITFGNPDASREEIVAAAQAANAHDFIECLPQGYDTLIGERGSTLSGGEKQRIAIARAFLKNAPILILDEPTAAVDAQTEKRLVEAIRRLMKDRTIVIIAHRLSTIQNANHVVVLEDGEVAESGVHEELLASDGLYRRYHEIQCG